jgi:hypothetical protein
MLGISKIAKNEDLVNVWNCGEIGKIVKIKEKMIYY